jgi:phage tail tube protein FII
VVKAIPKKASLGKFDMGAGQDSSWEGEVVYLKFSIDGDAKVEIDKYNFICVINGEDMLADVRAGLGVG